MSARSLAFQAASIRDVLPLAVNDGAREGLEGALATLLWLEKQSELLRMFDDLRRSRPELFLLMRDIAREFPGARIDNISTRED